MNEITIEQATEFLKYNADGLVRDVLIKQLCPQDFTVSYNETEGYFIVSLNVQYKVTSTITTWLPQPEKIEL